MRRLRTLPLLLALLTGCTPNGSVPEAASPSAETPSAVAVEPPFVEITQAARQQLQQLAAAQNAGNGWWLRVRVVPGGCQGVRSLLDLDFSGVGPGDVETICGGVRCLTSASHGFVIQGSRIDWIQNEKEKGFSVTCPNKTAANQKLATKWIDDALKGRQAEDEN